MKYSHLKKLLSLVFLSLLWLSSASAQSFGLKESIIQIVKAFELKNESVINEFIHPDIGIIILYRRGAVDGFEKVKQFDFNAPVPEYLPYESFHADTLVSFESLPSLDIKTQEWNKTGLYCDTIHKDHLLSKTARFMNKFKLRKIQIEEIRNFVRLEKQSHRVILLGDQEGELIFYVSRIGGKWYLTILDRLSGDFSA